jgi:hypothetical protein
MVDELTGTYEDGGRRSSQSVPFRRSRALEARLLNIRNSFAQLPPRLSQSLFRAWAPACSRFRTPLHQLAPQPPHLPLLTTRR